MKAGYSALVGAAVALATGVAKSTVSLITPAQFGADIQGMQIGFDGVTASDKAVLIELVAFTADGTGTAGVVNQIYGRTITPGFTSKYNYSAEPTTATVLYRCTVTPSGGTIWVPVQADVGVSTVVTIRCTAPTNPVNFNGGIMVERC